MKKLILLLVLVICCCNVLATPVILDYHSILKDVYVDSEQPEINTNSELLYLLGSSTGGYKNMLYTWDMSSLPLGNITSATLVFYLRYYNFNNNQSDVQLYNIYKIMNYSWQEDTATWSNNPCGEIGSWNSICNSTSYASSNWSIGNSKDFGYANRNIEFNITNLVNSYAPGEQNITFYMNATPFATGINELVVDFGQRNNPNASLIPYITLYVDSMKLNITAKGSGIYPINSFSVYQDSVLVGSTTEGYLHLNNLNRSSTYNITLVPLGYESKSVLLNTNGSYYQVYEFNVYPANSFHFLFKDEETEAAINTATLELIGSSFASNYSTNNASIFVDGIVPGLYSARYNSPGFNQGFYSFNLVNNTHTNITLYLLANTTASVVTATVYDERRNVVEGAYISILRYYLPTNSYVIRQIVKTNSEGVSRMNLQLGTEYYKFIIEYPFGVVRKITEPSYEYSTVKTFQINLGTSIGEPFYGSMDVFGDVEYNNDTNYFRYTFLDHNLAITKGCLSLYKFSASTESLFNSTCDGSTSNVLVLYAPPINNTVYRAVGDVYFGDKAYVKDSEYHDYGQKGLGGSNGLFWTAVLMLIFACFGSWNMTVGIILCPLPLIFGSLLRLIDMDMGLALGIEVLAIIVAVWLSKR